MRGRILTAKIIVNTSVGIFTPKITINASVGIFTQKIFVVALIKYKLLILTIILMKIKLYVIKIGRIFQIIHTEY